MNVKRLALLAALIGAAGALPAAMGTDPGTTSTTCAPVLASEVCTWVVMEGGNATELGVSIPIALVEAVPADAEMVWPPRELATIDFPAEARAALGFDHLGLNWEAHGHPPMTFLTPHFDFHFYFVPEAAVAAIDCADESKPAALPAPYALPDIEVPGMGRFVGLCVPGMGMHAMPAAEVDMTEPFGATMLAGYYGAEPIFLEPMVSRAMLLRREDFSLPVPDVGGSEGIGRPYPRSFTAEYDAAAEQYRLVFRGFDAE